MKYIEILVMILAIAILIYGIITEINNIIDAKNSGIRYIAEPIEENIEEDIDGFIIQIQERQKI